MAFDPESGVSISEDTSVSSANERVKHRKHLQLALACKAFDVSVGNLEGANRALSWWFAEQEGIGSPAKIFSDYLDTEGSGTDLTNEEPEELEKHLKKLQSKGLVLPEAQGEQKSH
jgi:hypothetical protein